jgi:hypothetical protein
MRRIGEKHDLHPWAGPCAWSARTAAEVPGVSIKPVREAVSLLVAGKGFEVTPNGAGRASYVGSGQFSEG